MIASTLLKPKIFKFLLFKALKKKDLQILDKQIIWFNEIDTFRAEKQKISINLKKLFIVLKK